MSSIAVSGYYPLKGEIEIQGSKNAVLPMMAAAILHRGTTTLTHVPRIQDVFCMMGILESMGCVCTLTDHKLTIDARCVTGIKIPKEDMQAMRSSIMVLGALLGRTGEAVAFYPGGCSIGSRPIDLHLYALKRLGAEIEDCGGLICARAEGLWGAEINFTYPSVGATENALLAAVTARGTTVIRGAAREPEVEALIQMLNGMGARVETIDTGVLKIEGVEALQDTVFDVPGDRIVAGTYLAAVMAAGGEAVLRRSRPEELAGVLEIMRSMGADIESDDDTMRIAMTRSLKAVTVETGPYPEFPTDLQSVMMVLLSLASGTGKIKENVFEERFATAKELQKMGAQIIIEGKEACIIGHYPLKPAKVKACDLRGGAALVVAGLAADGESEITDCRHIFRGYEDICRDLQSLGAKVRRKS